jgi:hypothetical protein
MAIEIPNSFRGKPVDGAIQIALKGSIQRNSSAPKPNGNPPSPSNMVGAEKYLILDGRKHGSYEYPDMLVSMDRYHLGKNWNDSHPLLAKDGNCMLTIRQFADFLNLLKSGNAYDGKGNKVGKTKLDEVLNDIVEVRNPWRAEWLDARFESGNIVYHVLKGNSVVEVQEPLNDYLNNDKTPGISLDSWLKDANQHGLPKKSVKKGDLYYWSPVDGRVARFIAISDGAVLDCYGYPSGTSSSLGVRLARAKI